MSSRTCGSIGTVAGRPYRAGPAIRRHTGLADGAVMGHKVLLGVPKEQLRSAPSNDTTTITRSLSLLWLLLPM
ncbi:hypothetical protein BASA61_001989 [Batrachochytrium salamandrivorans]|nr:hypothetical protein BASA61_001989 [Batrachochytrium salamandrivorans]